MSTSLTYLGGASEVGRVGAVLEGPEGRLLLDYGLQPDDPPKYPLPAPEVDALLDTMLGELDPDARAGYTRLVQSKLDEDPPLILAGFDSHRAVWGKHVHFPMDIRTQSIWGRIDTLWMDKR